MFWCRLSPIIRRAQILNSPYILNQPRIASFSTKRSQKKKLQKKKLEYQYYHLDYLCFKPFPRTVPDEVMSFEYVSYMSAEYMTPHTDSPAEVQSFFGAHRGEYKVKVHLNLSLLNEPDDVKYALRKIAGHRYNPGAQRIAINCDRFKSRQDNKEFLINQVEALLFQARKVVKDFREIMEVGEDSERGKEIFSEYKTVLDKLEYIKKYDPTIERYEESDDDKGPTIDDPFDDDEPVKK